MSIFKALGRVIEMPLRVTLDVVEAPFKIMDGEVPLKSTRDGLKKLAEDLNDED